MNRKYRLGFLLLLVLAILLSVGGVVLAANGFEINHWVIAGGGGRTQGGDYVLFATVGQAVVGGSSNSSYELCAGFWCGRKTVYQVYLPLAVRNK